MSSKIVNPLLIKEELVNDLTRSFNENLLSAVMFGSAVTPRYVAGKSDINIVLVVVDDSIEAMAELNRIEKEWGRRNVVFSFFFTPAYIQRSLDVYPMEFLEIKNSHVILYGSDFFTNLTLKPALLRLQCERELKGKLLHLKREYIRWRHRKSALRDLLNISFSQFLIVFRGLLNISGNREIPHSAAELCAALGQVLGVEIKPLHRIAAHPFPSNKKEIDELFSGYIKAVEAITLAVDNMSIE